jgi:lipid-A-disaccharide synthase
MRAAPQIYLIAGEASGDQLGAWLMAALARHQPGLSFTGVGGTAMRAVPGFTALFPTEDITIIGFAEILPHIFRIRQRIRATIADIEAKQPDLVITIDAPGFCFRVVRALKARGKLKHTRFIHYVAPTVWAYRPQRADEIAPLFSHLLALYPCEPPYFERAGLPTSFIGHPFAWWWREKGDAAAFRARHGLAAQSPLLALFPGSRKSELGYHLPVYRDTVTALAARIPNLELVMLGREEHREYLVRELKDWPLKVRLIDAAEKKDMFAAATAALAKSGTVSLECALAGLAAVTAYRAHPLTAWYVRRKVKIPYANMANILLERFVVPEFIQENFTPENLTTALLPLLTDAAAREAQRAALAQIARMLGAEDATSPSDKAAAVVLATLP